MWRGRGVAMGRKSVCDCALDLGIRFGRLTLVQHITLRVEISHRLDAALVVKEKVQASVGTRLLLMPDFFFYPWCELSKEYDRRGGIRAT